MFIRKSSFNTTTQQQNGLRRICFGDKTVYEDS
jgi:hypothetical protein